MSYDKELKEKRKLFCYYYITLGNIFEAAVKAGFPETSALIDGLNTLENPSCRLRIRRLRSILYQPASELVSTGLERLAFGNINDAVSLCGDDFPSPHLLAKLDLFSVSEIKKVKGGGIEIKFADRLRAMEKLLECERESSQLSNAENLINALRSDGQGDYNED